MYYAYLLFFVKSSYLISDSLYVAYKIWPFLTSQSGMSGQTTAPENRHHLHIDIKLPAKFKEIIHIIFLVIMLTRKSYAGRRTNCHDISLRLTSDRAKKSKFVLLLCRRFLQIFFVSVVHLSPCHSKLKRKKHMEAYERMCEWV